MIKGIVVSLLTCMGLVVRFSTVAQNYSLSQLFYPNVTMSTEFMPSVSSDGSGRYGLSRSSLLGFVPLRTEANLSVGIGKKLDLAAKHTFLVANLAQITPTIDGKDTPTDGYKTAMAGLIQLKASLREKLWLYGGGIGITESNETFLAAKPYLWGGMARVRIFGLNSQLLYGTVVIYNQKFRLIPIVGFNKKLGDWRVAGILPFQVNVSHKITDWFNVGFNAAVAGYSAGFNTVLQNEKLDRRENYQHLKWTLSTNFHVLKVFNLSLEGGVSTFRQLKLFNSAGDVYQQSTPSVAPYVGISARYITNKSKMTGRLVEKLGL